MIATVALVALSIAIGLTLYRVLRGPTWGDRILAFDFLGVSVAVMIVVIALKTGFVAFLDAALIVSILGFLSTVALSRYLLKGRVME
ncbi:monovalent cation/H+ antiporter complex subunit F [soil metagenome]|nr:monovalent cation/H+ antiporter complex subunit F [Deinococcota bacterium]